MADAIAYTDGASRGNPGPGALAFEIYLGDRLLLRQGKVIGTCTNNEAEYKAMIEALRNAWRLGLQELIVRSDSQLVINQMTGRWAIREPRLGALARAAREEASRLREVKYEAVPREHPRIREVDALCNRLLDEAGYRPAWLS